MSTENDELFIFLRDNGRLDGCHAALKSIGCEVVDDLQYVSEDVISKLELTIIQKKKLEAAVSKLKNQVDNS